MNLKATWAVFQFESGRTLALRRLAVSALLALFPIGMVTLMQAQGGKLYVPHRAAITLYVLVTEVVCLMGLLVWATPAILAELEGRTWSYLAVRPAGKGSVLLGKYLAAVAWTALTALATLSVCIFIVRPEEDTLRIWGVLAALTLFSCLIYGALFLLLGVVFLRRGMVVAVAYTVFLEVVVALIPAMINQLSVQYYLRNVGMKWLDLEERLTVNLPMHFSDAPPWQHLLILAGFTAALLTAAVLVLRRRELVTENGD
jgi:ABC-type transport system involved in multi-copper enzyme maturation permease subunit